MIYKTETQERFAQVLEGLRMPCIYLPLEGCFLMAKQQIRVMEKGYIPIKKNTMRQK